MEPVSRTYTIGGAVNAERDVACEIKIAGRDVRVEDIDALHDFVMLLAQAFRQQQPQPEQPVAGELELAAYARPE